MKYSAVIFDLFGTLVDDLAGPKYVSVVSHMASVLSVPVTEFQRLWFGTYCKRIMGAFSTMEENVAYVCRELGIQVEESSFKIAAQIRHDFARRSMMIPRVGAVEVLSQLKDWGHKIGLISDCSPAEPAIWPDTPLAPLFDAAVFSCSVNLKKPDHRIYIHTAKQLRVDAKDCLYVGNGGSDELSGAYEVAMHPVLLVPNKDVESLFKPPNKMIDFAKQGGTVISSLEEVLTLVR